MALTESEQGLLAADLKIKFFWAILVRYVVMLFGLFLLFYSYSNGINIGPIINLLAFISVYNLLAHAYYLVRSRQRFWQMFLAIGLVQLLDLLAVTYLIYLTGWLESPYWFLYLVMIIIAGFGYFSRYSSVVFLIALFSALFYFGLLFLTYFGIIPAYGPSFTLSAHQLLLLIINRAVFTISSFFLFAATIYYFSKTLTQNQDALAGKNRELVNAMEALRQIDRIKDDFVATASHELRTPLAVVRENISLVNDGLAGPVAPKQAQLLATAQQNIDRLAQILDSLLDIAKIESRSLELKRERVDIAKLAEQAAGLIMGLAEKKQISVVVKPPAGGALAWVDRDQILRVFINLLDNAIKYTPSNGQVTVIISLHGGAVRSLVADTGLGIAPEDLSLIFERFVRLTGAAEMANRGTGLGLSICKGIVELHGGKIWAESRPGTGTRVIFELPEVAS